MRTHEDIIALYRQCRGIDSAESNGRDYTFTYSTSTHRHVVTMGREVAFAFLTGWRDSQKVTRKG